MYLVSAFHPQLIKGEIIQYCKGLIAVIKNNHVPVEQSFSSTPLGDEDLKHHTLQPGDFVYWRRHLKMNSLQLCWKGSYQVLLTNPHAAKLQGIDSWIHGTHLKKALTPGWTYTSSESKDFPESKQVTAFPR